MLLEFLLPGNQLGIASQFRSEYVKGSACLLSLLQIGIVVLIFVHQEGIVDMYDAETVCGETLAQTAGILEFNDLVAADNRVEKVIVPIRDGLTIIYKKPGYVSE